jgi:type IV secretion system protein TrbL
VVTKLEAIIVMSAGYIFLGFGGSRWTSPYFERYISLAVSTGVRLMLIYLMLGVFKTISNNWIVTMNGYTADQPITQIFPTLMSMLLFAFASWMIPKMAASIASGTLGSGAADLVGMGAEIGKVAALGAATVAVVAATGGAGAVAGGAMTATETAGAMGGAEAATGAASAAGGMGEAAAETASAPAPPVPAAEAAGSPSSPPAPPPPSPANGPSETAAPPAPPSSANSFQSLARHATNINVPHDGSGHAPSAQLRIEREE